ncbi:hypothetical protein U0070_007978 [Myodes glareolus]|uniref:Uncharacterized protein n=1 Tax=Myodes glareolus TaxID=447135 RepID=A0AAW0IFT9_MYOGA
MTYSCVNLQCSLCQKSGRPLGTHTSPSGRVGKKRSDGSGPSMNRNSSWPHCHVQSSPWASNCCVPPPRKTCGPSSCSWHMGPGMR